MDKIIGLKQLDKLRTAANEFIEAKTRFEASVILTIGHKFGCKWSDGTKFLEKGKFKVKGKYQDCLRIFDDIFDVYGENTTYNLTDGLYSIKGRKKEDNVTCNDFLARYGLMIGYSDISSQGAKPFLCKKKELEIPSFETLKEFSKWAEINEIIYYKKIEL